VFQPYALTLASADAAPDADARAFADARAVTIADPRPDAAARRVRSRLPDRRRVLRRRCADAAPRAGLGRGRRGREISRGSRRVSPSSGLRRASLSAAEKASATASSSDVPGRLAVCPDVPASSRSTGGGCPPLPPPAGSPAGLGGAGLAGETLRRVPLRRTV